MQQLPPSERPKSKSSKICKISSIQVEHVNCNAACAWEIYIRNNKHLHCYLQISIQSTPDYWDKEEHNMHK